MREFGSSLTAKLLFPRTKLPTNSLLTPNFLTKNYPSVKYFGIALSKWYIHRHSSVQRSVRNGLWNDKISCLRNDDIIIIIIFFRKLFQSTRLYVFKTIWIKYKILQAFVGVGCEWGWVWQLFYGKRRYRFWPENIVEIHSQKLKILDKSVWLCQHYKWFVNFFLDFKASAI